MTHSRTPRLGLVALGIGLLAHMPTGPLAAQGAINPIIAPHAADLARAGEREAAKSYLGQYLSRSTDDPKAWLQLGKIYLDDAREWHLRGHVGEPDASILLDFAATSLDQTIRLSEDSGSVLRGYAGAGRDLLLTEQVGWDRVRASRGPVTLQLPAPVVELGLNLVASCPSDEASSMSPRRFARATCAVRRNARAAGSFATSSLASRSIGASSAST